MSNNAQGFWDINNLNDYIVKINGSAITQQQAINYPAVDSNYTIEVDDNNINVLILHNTTATTLTMAASGVDYSAIGEPIEYIGGRPPHRPTKD
jgi:hypothetical protein